MEEKQVKVNGGRKRKNLVKFYLNDEEYQKLCENAATFGRDKSKYLRLVIQWIAPRTFITSSAVRLYSSSSTNPSECAFAAI